MEESQYLFGYLALRLSDRWLRWAAIGLVTVFGMLLPPLESHRRHVTHKVQQVAVAQHLPYRVSLPDVEPVVVVVDAIHKPCWC